MAQESNTSCIQRRVGVFLVRVFSPGTLNSSSPLTLLTFSLSLLMTFKDLKFCPFSHLYFFILALCLQFGKGGKNRVVTHGRTNSWLGSFYQPGRGIMEAYVPFVTSQKGRFPKLPVLQTLFLKSGASKRSQGWASLEFTDRLLLKTVVE